MIPAMEQTLSEIIANATEEIEKMLDNGHEKDDVWIRAQKSIIEKATELSWLVDNAF